MNKRDLAGILAKNVDLSQEAARTAVNSIVDAITESVAVGDSVMLVGFGTFKQSARAARTGRNPQTGAELTIPAMKVPKFTPGASFRAAVAGRKLGVAKSKMATKAKVKSA
jgi:DNA-binding protein HU-beta